MNAKLYERACKYIDKMLSSFREDWTVKRLFLKENRYLQIEVDRITQEELDQGEWGDWWKRGTAVGLQLYVTDKHGVELDGCTVQSPLEQQYPKDLEYLLGMFT